MTSRSKYLGPLLTGDEITSEIKRRKKACLYKTVSGRSKNAVAEKVKREERAGWRVFRRNRKSTRMEKPKPADERLEDDVWCILAQMGFREMSDGRQFWMSAANGDPAQEIDVFAKDDETAIVVECKQRSIPGRERMARVIEEVRHSRREIVQAIRGEYGRDARLKIKNVIVTRNISWSDRDLDECERARIAVLTEGELEYYSALVQHIKHAARYQFLAHIFAGQKIDGLVREVVATRGRMGGTTFYTFLMRPDELLKLAYVGHKASRDIDNVRTYQRMLQPRRLKAIARYINNGGKFPTNIVVNLKTGRRRRLRFDVQRRVGDEAFGTLHLPPRYGAAWVIDGQHRLYGYAFARLDDGFNEDSTRLSVLAYDNLPATKEADLFIDINSKQVKVSTGLLVELYADLHWCSPDREQALQALRSRIAWRLNSDKTSPLYDRMVVAGKKKSRYRCLTQTSIRDGLRRAKLVGTHRGGEIMPGPLSTANAYDYEANLRKGLSVLGECLRMFAARLRRHWELGANPGGYLCTNNGIRALFHVIEDIAVHLREKEGVDLHELSAGEAFAEIEPYLEVLVEFFEGASAHEIQAFRDFGSSLAAVRRQGFGLDAHIAHKIAGFEPPGLQRYLDSRDEAGTEEAAVKVRSIQSSLFGYVIGTLKRHYGEEGDGWWTRGIPVKIRKDCMNRWEDNDRRGQKESQLYLIHYIDICVHRWELFRDVISLDARNKDNKRANTKWIKELNDIRNITAHPERGVLSPEQVAFVDECFKKVKAFFP